MMDALGVKAFRIEVIIMIGGLRVVEGLIEYRRGSGVWVTGLAAQKPRREHNSRYLRGLKQLKET